MLSPVKSEITWSRWIFKIYISFNLCVFVAVWCGQIHPIAVNKCERIHISISEKCLFFHFVLATFRSWFTDMNAKHGKYLLTNLLPKFAIQMVLGDNRYNLSACIAKGICECTNQKRERVRKSSRIKRKNRGCECVAFKPNKESWNGKHTHRETIEIEAFA